MGEELELGMPVVYFTDANISVEGIEESAERLDEFREKLFENDFKVAPLTLVGTFEAANQDELEMFMLEAIYGEKIKTLVAKLNGEWKSKFYKV